MGKMKQATYRAAVLSVEAARTKPATAMERPTVICHVRSWTRPEFHPKRIPAAPAKMKGGQVMTRVIVVLKPSVLTTLTNELANCKSVEKAQLT